MTLVSLISYSQYPTTKIIGKDSVVIITTKQAEKINNTYVKMIDSISTIKSDIISIKSYQTQIIIDKLEALDKISYLEQSLDAHKILLSSKDKELEILKMKKRSPMLVTMLLLVGWTLYTGIQTQTIK